MTRRSLGYQIRVLEVSTPSEESKRRLIARDGDGAKVKLHDKWANTRIQWQEDPRWQTLSHGNILALLLPNSRKRARE